MNTHITVGIRGETVAAVEAEAGMMVTDTESQAGLAGKIIGTTAGEDVMADMKGATVEITIGMKGMITEIGDMTVGREEVSVETGEAQEGIIVEIEEITAGREGVIAEIGEAMTGEVEIAGA